jgi:hypothetical protein
MIESEHCLPRDYLFPGTKVWCLVCAGLSHPKIIQGEIDMLTYNEMGEGRWWYYVKVPRRYSKYVCEDPTIYSPRSRGMSRNYVYLTREEALEGANQQEGRKDDD